MTIKYAQHTFYIRYQFIFFQKFKGAISQHGLCTQSTTQYDLKASLLLPIYFADTWYRPNIMHECKRGIFFAAGEGYLEFATHLLANRFPKKIFKGGMC